MRKIVVFVLVSTLVVLFTGNVFALTSPVISKGHGDIALSYTSGQGAYLSAEYGILQNLALLGNVSFPLKYSGGGLKLRLTPALAAKGGMIGTSPYLAFNGASKIIPNLKGIFEIGTFMTIEEKLEFSIYFECGLLYRLPNNLDIRAAASKRLEKDTTPGVELGMGYNF